MMLLRSTRLVVLLAALLSVAGLPAWGQSWAGRGRLQGTVKDESGKPIQGATITLRKGGDRVDPNADGPKPLTTDKNGKWSILGLSGGSWGILIQKEGFMDSEGRINVEEYSVGVPQPINIVLKAPPKATAEQAQAVQQQNTQAAEAKAAIERGNAMLQQEKYADARAAFQEGMAKLNEAKIEDKDKNPILVSLHRAVAQTYYQEKNLNAAIDSLKQALALAPDDQASLQLIVNLLVAANREPEAKTYMAKLPQGTTVDPNTLLNLGIKAFNENKMDDALAQFNRVITENPSLADAYYYRAMVYLNQQKNALAKADLQKLLSMDPNNAHAKDAKEFLKELK